jgi:hypothetical protein
MFLEAFNQGLIMHGMGGLDVQKAREVFNIPEDYEVGIMITIGYQGTHNVPNFTIYLVESLLLSEKEMAEEARNSSIGSKRSGDDYQRQTILNLYNSGIERDIISLQLDVSKEEVNKTIEEEEQKKKESVTGAEDISDSHAISLSSSFYLDAIVDIRCTN